MNGDRNDLSADDVIALLGLTPHPEGGAYRETFRDLRLIDGEGRSASTAIYFLLRAEELSRWHRVDATEIWHWYAGAPLELRIAEKTGSRTDLIGNDLQAGQRPQGIVPAYAWQQARSLGTWTLVGCTVAPAFEFASFELAAENFSP